MDITCRDQHRRAHSHRHTVNIVRPGRELHRRAMLCARRQGMSLGAVVTGALRGMPEGDGRAA